MAAIVKLDAEIKLSMAGAHEAEMEALLTKAGEIVEAAVEKGDIIQAENGRLYAREHAPEHLRVKQNERDEGGQDDRSVTRRKGAAALRTLVTGARIMQNSQFHCLGKKRSRRWHFL